MRCLDDNDIAWLTSAAPSAVSRSPFTEHLDACVKCRTLVAEALRLDGHSSTPSLRSGDRVGRYLVLETLGAGAMGVVHAAWDPELNRKVALKLLHADPVREGQREEGRARLMREAQSLARLAHPHVVTVHDVGTTEGEDGQVFLAMEFLDGGTLRERLAAQPLGWREVVTLVAQVGDGLAAAHEAHLIHRDLKPENVLVDGSGRPRLTDFGLASGQVEVPEPGVELEREITGSLTATGALVGTPAYMAPEQLRGERATELSDQFSFCVMLFEALSGARPFSGETVKALLHSSAQPPVGPQGVPRWLQRVLARGLSASPSARYPSMKALNEALRSGLSRRPRRLWAALTAVVVATLVIGFTTAQRRAPCSGGPEAWGSAWDETVDAPKLQAAFEQTGLGDASERARQTSRLLTDARARWLASWTHVCSATRESGEQSAALLDLRMECLTDRRNELAALARELEAPAGDDVERVEHSISAVLSLPSVERCAEVRGGAAPAQADAELVQELSVVQGRLRALDLLGRGYEARALLVPALEKARAAGLTTQTARLLFLEGKLAFHAADSSNAEKWLNEAAATAEEARDDGTAADAWMLLITLTGRDLGRPEEARRWGRYADAAIRRAGGDVEREALRLRQLSLVISAIEGNLDEALALARRARRAFDGIPPGERRDFNLVLCDEVIADITFNLGHVEEALVIHRELEKTQQRLFGPRAGGLAIARVNIGEDLATLRRADEALPWLREALSLTTELGLPQGYYLHRLAFGLRQRGDVEAALIEDTKSLVALEAEHSSRYWRSWAQYGQGLDLLALGRPKEAVVRLEEAVQGRLKEAPPVDLSDARAALGRAKWELGDQPGGREEARLALELLASRSDAPAFTARQRTLEAWLAAHSLRK